VEDSEESVFDLNEVSVLEILERAKVSLELAEPEIGRRAAAGAGVA
jgi:hypothetical protein